jgi:DNA-binding LytR/AlgR family response regulator
LDFLVKPVSDARLVAALERAVQRIAEARALRAALDAPDAADSPTPFLRQIIIPERGRRLIVPVDDVEWIEGDTYYVRIHAEGRVRLLRQRLAWLESSLDPSRFVRTHRSALVRIDLIREIASESPYSFSARLATGDKVPVSRERLKRVEAVIRR